MCFLYLDRAEPEGIKVAQSQTQRAQKAFVMIFVSKKMSFSYLPLQRNVGKQDGDPVSSLTFSSCECVCVCVCVHAPVSSVLSDSLQSHGL